jgi:hypothetical protein
MNSLEFARQTAREIVDLCHSSSIDDDTRETYENMANIVLMQCAEMDDWPNYSIPTGISYLKGQINALNTMREYASILVAYPPAQESIDNPEKYAAWQDSYRLVDDAWKKLFKGIDSYPNPGKEDRDRPTTMRSVI